jgi:hypothetical protein
MGIENYYEEITEAEANFIIAMYQAISNIVRDGRPVTMVGLAFELDVKPTELSDYLPQIIHILDRVEEEYQVQ